MKRLLFLALAIVAALPAADLGPGPTPTNTTLLAPGPIGSTTPSSGAFTTLSATGQFTSTQATGTAPFVIASTTQVANLNVSQLEGGTWEIPGAIGSTTPNTGAFSSVSATGAFTTTNAGTVFGATAATTNAKYAHVQNTGADFYIGVEASGAGTFFTGSAAYDCAVYSSGHLYLAGFGGIKLGGGAVTINDTTATALQVAGGITSTSATRGIGYATGAGGAGTQATSKSTAVTLNTACGTITMNGASLAAATSVAFTLTDSAIAATDVVVCVHDSVGTLGGYSVVVTPASGSATVTVRNNTAGALAEAIVLRFAVIKATVN